MADFSVMIAGHQGATSYFHLCTFEAVWMVTRHSSK